MGLSVFGMSSAESHVAGKLVPLFRTIFGMFIIFGMVSFTGADVWSRPTDSTRTKPLSPRIDFYPQELKAVVEGELRHVSFGIAWENASSSNSDELEGEYQVIVFSENTDILEIVNSSYFPCIQPKDEVGNFTFTVRGLFLGFTKTVVQLVPAPSGCHDDRRMIVTSHHHQFLTVSPGDVNRMEVPSGIRKFELSVSVIRSPSILVNIVTGLMAALVAFNYINMGVQLDLHCIGKVLKRPIGPCIGFVCQFFFMPLASYGISYLLLDDISLRLGLFTLGCSPGGSMSNFWTLLFKGDVNLSITMTFISTIAALAMMPLWIFTLGSKLFRSQEATIPYINLAGSLILLTVPIGIGLLIRQYSPRLSKVSRKIIQPVTIICVLAGIGVGMYINSFIFTLFTWRIVTAGIAIAWGGYTFGALMAWVGRLDRSQIIAVSIETAFQNPAVAFVMLMLSLPQPEADLTSVPVIAQLLVTGVPMWTLLLITRIHSGIKRCRDEDEKMIESVNIDTLNKEYMALESDPRKVDGITHSTSVK